MEHATHFLMYLANEVVNRGFRKEMNLQETASFHKHANFFS